MRKSVKSLVLIGALSLSMSMTGCMLSTKPEYSEYTGAQGSYEESFKRDTKILYEHKDLAYTLLTCDKLKKLSDYIPTKSKELDEVVRICDMLTYEYVNPEYKGVYAEKAKGEYRYTVDMLSYEGAKTLSVKEVEDILGVKSKTQDSDPTTGQSNKEAVEMGVCYTCGKEYPVSEMEFNGRSYRCKNCQEEATKDMCHFGEESGIEPHNKNNCKYFHEDVEEMPTKCDRCGSSNIENMDMQSYICNDCGYNN